MLKRLVACFTFASLLLGSPAAYSGDDSPASSQTSPLSNRAHYIAPWDEWERIREQAIASETKTPPPGAQAALVTLTSDGLYVFVWLDWIYWRATPQDEGMYMIRSRLMKPGGLAKVSDQHAPTQPGSYALLIVLAVPDSEAPYEWKAKWKGTFQTREKCFDLARIQTLFPQPPVEYGIGVTSYNPLTWELVGLFKGDRSAIEKLLSATGRVSEK